MQKNIYKLNKQNLLRLMRAYDKYVKEFFEVEEHEGSEPICLDEYFDNEYSYYLECGDLISFYDNLVDDEDLIEWLDNNDKSVFEVSEVEDDKFFIENCPYGIWINEYWHRVEIPNGDFGEYYFKLLMKKAKFYGFKSIGDYCFKYEGYYIELRKESIGNLDDLYKIDFGIFESEEDMNTSYALNIYNNRESIEKSDNFWENLIKIIEVLKKSQKHIDKT